ncbi:hypothetical protein B23_0430 [Geobacillus thermoleovorans B23]|nr:hypothetical protein B23_0430 [Geobacillus thermoleovorans B23]
MIRHKAICGYFKWDFFVKLVEDMKKSEKIICFLE